MRELRVGDTVKILSQGRRNIQSRYVGMEATVTAVDAFGSVYVSINVDGRKHSQVGYREDFRIIEPPESEEG